MNKLLMFFIGACASFSASAFNTSAKSAFLLDFDSGAEIVAKNADKLMPPSSMLKLMTLAVAFDALKSGELKMTDMLPVSQNADYKNPKWSDASKICLSAGQKISARDALMGIIVLSGGDAGVVVAERLADSESNFTALMLKKARAIGMSASSFGNATGLPHPDNLMTSRELATLASHLISDAPELYPMFATRKWEFGNYQSGWCADWGKTHTLNYNKLLFVMPGADGLKTGHTTDGGYGMVASAKQGGRRLIAVINGFKGRDHNALAAEAKKLLQYGFANTTSRTFYKAGDKIAAIPVWYGRQDFVIATVEKNFAITTGKNQNLAKLQIIARYDEPVVAPVAAGQGLGEIFAELDGKIVARAPLVAAGQVGKTRLFKRVIQNLRMIF